MNQYREERDKLATKLAYQKSLVRDAVAEVKQVREYLAAAQAQVEEMEAELELCGDERDRLREEKQALEQHVRKLTAEIAGPPTLPQDVQIEYAEVDRLQRELSEAQLRALKAEAEAERLQEKLEDELKHCRQYQAEVERANAHFNEAVAERDAEIERLQQENALWQSHDIEKQREVERLQKHLALEHSDEMTYMGLQARIADFESGRVYQELQARITTLIGDVNFLGSRLAESDKERVALAAQVDHYKDELFEVGDEPTPAA